MENQLLESEEKYRLNFENSPMGLLSFDEKGVIVACNDIFVNIIGSSHEALIGLNMLDLPDKNLTAAVQQALSGSPGFYQGLYSSMTSNKITPVRCLFKSINIGGGQITGGVGIIEDISERIRAEEQIRYQAGLLQNVSDAIIATDKEGRIQVWNKAAETLYGWKAEEALGKIFHDMIKPEYRYQSRDEVLEKMDQEGAWSGELIHHLRNGRQIPVQSTITMLKDAAGNPAGSVSVNHDISERKQAEEQIRLR